MSATCNNVIGFFAVYGRVLVLDVKDFCARFVPTKFSSKHLLR